MSINPQDLPTLPRGSHKYLLDFQLPLEHYNAVADAARRYARPSSGSATSTGSIQRVTPRYHDRVMIKPNFTLPPYNIAVVTGQINSSTPQTGNPVTIFDVRQINVNPLSGYGGKARVLGYVVNEGDSIYTNTPGYATWMKPYIPVKCAVSNAYAPQSGQWCGVTPATSIISSQNIRDLMCVSTDTTTTNSLYGCEVMWIPNAEMEGTFAALAQATDPWTGAKTANFTEYTEDYGSSANPATFSASGAVVIAVNRDISLNIPANTYGAVRFINGEWRVAWIAC